MSLDERLTDIINENLGVGNAKLHKPITDKLVDQIKQAFAGEGYLEPERGGEVWEVGQNIMTGQEWIARLDDYLEHNRSALKTGGGVYLAAKKAAGL